MGVRLRCIFVDIATSDISIVIIIEKPFLLCFREDYLKILMSFEQVTKRHHIGNIINSVAN